MSVWIILAVACTTGMRALIAITSTKQMLETPVVVGRIRIKMGVGLARMMVHPYRRIPCRRQRLYKMRSRESKLRMIELPTEIHRIRTGHRTLTWQERSQMVSRQPRRMIRRS